MYEVSVTRKCYSTRPHSVQDFLALLQKILSADSWNFHEASENQAWYLHPRPWGKYGNHSVLCPEMSACGNVLPDFFCSQYSFSQTCYWQKWKSELCQVPLINKIVFMKKSAITWTFVFHLNSQVKTNPHHVFHCLENKADLQITGVFS